MTFLLILSASYRMEFRASHDAWHSCHYITLMTLCDTLIVLLCACTHPCERLGALLWCASQVRRLVKPRQQSQLSSQQSPQPPPMQQQQQQQLLRPPHPQEAAGQGTAPLLTMCGGITGMEVRAVCTQHQCAFDDPVMVSVRASTLRANTSLLRRTQLHVKHNARSDIGAVDEHCGDEEVLQTRIGNVWRLCLCLSLHVYCRMHVRRHGRPLQW